MQVSLRNLLAVAFWVGVASCSLNDHGLGGTDAHPQRFDSGALTGAAGSSGAGVSGAAGTMPEPTGAAGIVAMTGEAGMSGAAGTSAAAGAGGAPMNVAGTNGDPGSGAAGSSTAGKGGTNDGGAGANVPDAGGAGSGVAGKPGNGTAGTGAAGTAAAGTAGSATGQIGCADGAREGYLDRVKYPKIAACAGGWEEPGLTSDDSKVPQCERRAGDDGDRADGKGCSVADLCAAGWHVCESAAIVATLGTSCADAIQPFQQSASQAFFVTRQRGIGDVCDADNQQGTNNIFGCGTVGSAADKSCAPLTRLLRDSDCQYAFPWVCAQGPIGTSQQELSIVTKRGSTRGGVLCCKD